MYLKAKELKIDIEILSSQLVCKTYGPFAQKNYSRTKVVLD